MRKKYKNISEVALILVSILTLGYFFYEFMPNNKINPIILGKNINASQFSTVTGNTIDFLNSKTSATILILFDTNNDCASCLSEFILWNKLYELYSTKIRIIGIGYAPNQNYLRLWGKARKIKFPLIYDGEKKFITGSELATPVKILINKNNTVTNLHYSSDFKDSQAVYSDFIDSLYNSYK